MPPDPGWFRRQERAAEAWGEIQGITHTESVKNNMTDGSGDNKGGKPNGGKIGVGIVVIGSATRIIMEMTNPNPSQDAAEAHQEKVEEKLNQSPQDLPPTPSLIERFINWLKE